ncbi:hypothetical protein ASZ90_017099 [hydrocarbon metagenome]|uniref:Uncharacterized protein n=1 Tax=hydrocarbon metagenome TaxID=938273 RepID=A0A0W8E9W4_9ZZZZ
MVHLLFPRFPFFISLCSTLLFMLGILTIVLLYYPVSNEKWHGEAAGVSNNKAETGL